MMNGGRGSCSCPSMRKPTARPRAPRGPRRGVSPPGAPPVPLLLRRTEFLEGHLRPLLPQFVIAAAGALPGGRGQENLHLGGREDHPAAVPPRPPPPPPAPAPAPPPPAAKGRAPCGVSRNSNPRVRAISASTAASSSGTPRRSASRATARYIQPVLM